MCVKDQSCAEALHGWTLGLTGIETLTARYACNLGAVIGGTIRHRASRSTDAMCAGPLERVCARRVSAKRVEYSSVWRHHCA